MYSEMLTTWLRCNYIWRINFSRNFHYDLSFGQIEPVWPLACLSLNLMSLTHNFRTNWKYSRGISSYDMKWHKIVKTQFFIDRHFRFPSQKLWLRILLCIIACVSPSHLPSCFGPLLHTTNQLQAAAMLKAIVWDPLPTPPSHLKLP